MGKHELLYGANYMPRVALIAGIGVMLGLAGVWLTTGTVALPTLLIAGLLLLVGLQTYLIYRLVYDRNKYYRLSISDALTGIANCRYLKDIGQAAIAAQQSVGVLFMDVDQFKRINDAFGHLVGNEGLIQIAQMLQEETLPENAVVGRIGGDEFLIVLLGCSCEEVCRLREKLLNKFARHQFKINDNVPPIKISVSIGVAFAPPQSAIGFEDLICSADKSMYIKKTCLASS